MMHDLSLFGDATFWVLVSFILFLVVAWKFGSKTVLGVIDTRIESIRSDLRSAEALRIEAQELLAQYQRKFRDADKEAAAIVESARKNAEQMRRKAEADLAETLRRKEALLEARIKRVEEETVNDIRARAAALALEAAARMIREKVDERVHADIVEKSFADLERRIAH